MDIEKVNARFLEFGKVQAKKNSNFIHTKYKNANLKIETPFLFTPTGICSENQRTWMDVELNCSNDPKHKILFDLFKAIDDRCLNYTIDRVKKWFNGTMTGEMIEETFKSPIIHGWGNEPALLRFEIEVSKPEDLIDADGHVVSSEEVSPLSTVKVQLELIGLWISENFLGCHWKATNIVAQLPKKPEKEAPKLESSSPDRPDTPLPRIQMKRSSAKSESKNEKTNKSEKVNNKSESRIEKVKNVIKNMRKSKEDNEEQSVPKKSIPDATDAIYYHSGKRSDYSESYDDSDSGSDDRRRRSYYYSDSDDRRRRYSSESSSYDSRRRRRHRYS